MDIVIIIVLVYNHHRLARSLLSLLSFYQKGISGVIYIVIIVFIRIIILSSWILLSNPLEYRIIYIF